MSLILEPQVKRDINWITIAYLLGLPLSAFLLFSKAQAEHVFFWPIIVYAIIHYSIDCLCITVGYHRFISHKAFEAHPAIKALILFAGAGAFQNSALVWARDHRVHHREVDTDDDPYSINKGFWYAHFFWMFHRDPKGIEKKTPPDLKKDALIQLQHRFYLPLAILVGFLIPMFVGYLMGSAFAGLYVGAILRLISSGHCTFMINSVAHVLGTRPYSVNNTARDNWFLSILTFGEGYHNYHHRFQADYRNGPVWYAWDPSKWIIFGLSRLGLAHGLIRVDEEKIRLARMEVTEQKLEQKGLDIATLVKKRMEVLQIAERIQTLREDLEKMKSEGKAKMDRSERALVYACKRKLKEMKRARNNAVKQWKEHRKLIQSLPHLQY